MGDYLIHLSIKEKCNYRGIGLMCQGCQTRTKPNARPDSGSNKQRALLMAVRGQTGVGRSRADVGVVQRSRQSRGRGAGVGRRRADVDGGGDPRRRRADVDGGGDPRWRRADVDGDWSGRGYLDNRQRQDGCRRRTKTDTKTMTVITETES